MDCGPTCLRMVARHYGRTYSLQTLREKCFLSRQGVSLLGISYAAEKIGLRTLSVKTTFESLASQAPLPCIAHWNQNHFVVVYKIGKGRVRVADPASGVVTYTEDEFLRGWASIRSGARPQGTLLLLEPTPAFFEGTDEASLDRSNLRFFLRYLRGFGGAFTQVALGMGVASLLQLVFPFLTQAIVDHGITNHDLSFVYLVLIAQLMLFMSRTAIEFIRNRVLFHLGTRVFVSILSDFLFKLMKLPIPFFDSRMIGDLLQRVHDHSRVQQFLTTTTLGVLFSVFTLVVFSAVLALYSFPVFLVFAAGSAVYLGYVLLFVKWRKEIDYLRFAEMARNQTALVELLAGMQEIKLNNAEQQRRWGWERVQARLFKVNLRGLSLDQAQEGGATFINELKNIAVSFLAAKLVIDGELTLGMLLAIQYILGQLNSPLSQLVSFVHSAQDAKISLERLAEIHGRPDEEHSASRLIALTSDRALALRGVCFHYGGPLPETVLDQVDLEVPQGKVTAIVGPSGSGKTTLLKLLLRFYEPVAGEILVGGVSLRNVSNRAWREQCGVVMQDGYLFADTIANNITVGHDTVDMRRLLDAARIANIHEFVGRLPLGFDTRVGRDGLGMSQGQKQRILIARAVYKDPAYLFFDEATSSLDANNERKIMDNLRAFVKGRTVVVIAHRLSTVRTADQIVVLDGGAIVERGTHQELTRLRGKYFELVKNQLELGN